MNSWHKNKQRMGEAGGNTRVEKGISDTARSSWTETGLEKIKLKAGISVFGATSTQQSCDTDPSHLSGSSGLAHGSWGRPGRMPNAQDAFQESLCAGQSEVSQRHVCCAVG